MVNTTMNSTIISIVDNEAQLIVLVNFLNKIISQIAFALIIIMGNIGSILTCIVFSQPTYRKSPCAMYFFASSFSQLFTFNFACLTRMLQYAYGIQIINTNLWFCRIRFYLFYILVAIPRYNIIMATIDRYFASSRDALRRQWSSPKLASRFIIVNVIFWCLIYIQVIIFYNINTGACQYQTGVYSIFFSIYISIDSGILPLFLMFIFGLLTVRNIHQTKKRIEPATGNSGKITKKDIQFHKMLANQICLYLILNVPNPCYLVYRTITLYTIKSPFRLATETFVSNMTYVLIYFGFSLTFVNFIISSQIFRKEFIQIIRTRIFRRAPLPLTTIGGTTLRIPRPNDIQD
ncbi:unnamed protein product [Adineta steineri]|uniref:G-protein coupled receptors family 1 profile domain-containing protein n=1 Tax=Adineta steineri TaxID=433720 RepID=A0A815JJK7_9BILA|nr:unnamed protein product [Adineta steineri]